MRRVLVVLALALGCSAFRAEAADQPIIGEAPPAWVLPAEIPEHPAPSAAAVHVILQDVQSHFGPEGDQTYSRSVFQIQTPQGLAGAGSIQLQWDPAIDTVSIHTLMIRRGAETIDVLAKQKFTILRREKNLQYAMLDGVLTAALQVEGLQVGDIVDLSETLTRKDPVLKGRSELTSFGVSAASIDHLRLRALWPSAKTMQWRASDDLGTLKPVRLGAETEVMVDLKDAQPLHPPEGAPMRYLVGRRLEFSEFRSWADVSSLFAPLYVKAAALKSDSPLKAEIAKIKAASSDPKTQAEAALQLVQNQVHYVFLGMNLGGLVPADADETWTRRFGDCKGKTALLIALLNGLGIKAEPAVVSSTLGDGLDERLPAVNLFDHILVRAEIVGKVYWLDGTRMGDVSLDRLRTPAFKWALPIRASGATLVRLTQEASKAPDYETTLEIDASKGIEAKASVHAEMIVRGDLAFFSHTQFQNQPPAELERSLKKYWTTAHDTISPTTVSESYDAATGIQTFKMDGVYDMDWESGLSRPAFEVDDASLGGALDIKRDGLHAEAPFKVDFPVFSRSTETIKLPNEGKGFITQGDDVDVTVAATHYVRTTHIEGDTLRMSATVQTLAEEFPAAEAPAAAKKLKDMGKVRVFVIAPVGSLEKIAPDPKTAAEFLARGNDRMAAGRRDEALADIDQALALEPGNGEALAARGIIYIYKNDLEHARTDIDKARAISPDDLKTLYGLGLLALRDNNPPEAIKAFNGVLAQTPDDVFALEQVAYLQSQAGAFEAALKAADRLVAIAPGNTRYHERRVYVLGMLGRSAEALEEITKSIAANPTYVGGYRERLRLLVQLNRLEEARKDSDKIMELGPISDDYVNRVSLRQGKDVEKSREDLAAALKLNPKSVVALGAFGQLELHAKNYEAALGYFTKGLEVAPGDPSLLVGRADSYAGAGKTALAQADYAAVRKGAAKDAALLNKLCWAEATNDIDLNAALADCNASLTLSPDSPMTLDSRAFAELRMGALDQALADYDAALKAQPTMGASLYGRGLVKLRKGMKTAGEADLAAARASSPSVDEEFAGYGLAP